jgi:4-amino-4-deoxy-L-arabinose transferase-like glycosyltransferase
MRVLFTRRWFLLSLVLVFATAIYLGCAISPPSLMDDVDAVQAQIAKTMLTSGDWVTARLDGVVYLEKGPLIYWLMAILYKVFGVADWVARLPVALASIALALLSSLFGMWAFGKRAGFYTGLCMSTCVGLFLFTRVQIPDVMLTLSITLALWAFLRTLDEEEKRPRQWAAILAASLGTGLLIKSLVAIFFQNLAAAAAHQWFSDCVACRCPLARVGDPSEPSVFCVDAEERPGNVSRILLVLFYK